MILKNTILLLIFLLSFIFSQNNFPIVLIHGFLGWGRDELSGYYYWGGVTDLEQILIDEGYNVITVSVGPISPNYERAIEVYYQIKGGQVDYGKNHSNKIGIIRKPNKKSYSGLYPKWDSNNPIHIIAHSQGGQTARVLEMILKSSSNIESSDLLGKNLRGFIKSITTISTPHNGTTLVPLLLDIFPFSLDLAPWLGGIKLNSIKSIYNFDLEHWGLEKIPNENMLSYWNRIRNSPLSSIKNLCTWELSPEGADSLNNLYNNDSNIYYFSFSTSATKLSKNNSKHIPTKDMSVLLRPTSRLMGTYKKQGTEWHENDGICNTISMHGPSGSLIKEFDGKPQKGVWQKMKKLKTDHQEVIGHLTGKDDFKNMIVLYKDHAKLLSNLK